jgi:TonB family protein
MQFAISRKVAAIATMAVLAGGSAGAAPTCGAPGWVHAPSAGDLDAAYPAKAHAAGVTGRAALLCALRPDGSLADCAVESEDPPGAGFGAAALTLSGKLQAAPSCEAAGDRPSQIRVPIRFDLPPQPPARQPVFRKLPADFSSLQPLGPFWPEAALRQGIGGAAAIDCHVSDAGKLSNCKIADERPGGSDFGHALLAMANKGWLTAGPADAAAPTPADGVWRLSVVLAPHRF